jgi:hypothetical protein
MFSLFLIIKFAKIYYLIVTYLFVPSMLMTLLFPIYAFTYHVAIFVQFIQYSL